MSVFEQIKRILTPGDSPNMKSKDSDAQIDSFNLESTGEKQSLGFEEQKVQEEAQQIKEVIAEIPSFPLSNYISLLHYLPSKLQENLNYTIQCLQLNPLNLHMLKQLSFEGMVDECKGLRSEIQESSKQSYEAFAVEFMGKEEKPLNFEETQYQKQFKIVQAKDHPLSKQQVGARRIYQKDQTLWKCIITDGQRTRSEFHFFAAKLHPRTESMQVESQKNIYDDLAFAFDSDDKKDDNLLDIQIEEKIELKPIKSKFDCQDLFHSTTHVDILCRMLYVYAKLNPSISYSSGMNEIIANLYYIFYNDALSEQQQFAEADTFFCFNNLMTELQGFFVPQLEKGENGILTKLSELDNLLLVLDPELALHLKNNNIQAMIYAHRWFVLLLSREFDFTFVLKIWDALLAHQNKMKFLTALCLALVISKREFLLAHLISDILLEFQKSNNEFESFFKLAKEIYEKIKD